MSYLYATPGGAATAQSPYAAQQATAHSPYMAPGQVQPGVGSVYPHSPYVATTPQTLAAAAQPGAYPGQAYQPSPMVGQTYLPSGGQLAYGATATQGSGAMTASTTSSAQPSQPFSGNVTPGAVTYTTTTDALGRVTYHHFRAEPATYRSPQGVTYTGIQWVPTETSSVPPVGIAPAGPDVLASFRGQLPTAAGSTVHTASTTPAASNAGLGLDYRDDGRDWDREERHHRREEKKRNAAWEAERVARERAEDREMRKERERDVEMERASRMRRQSYGTGLGADLNAPPYERERSRVRGDQLRERELREREGGELERKMGELDVSGRDGYYGEYGAPGTRSRRQSMSARAAPRGIYDDPAHERDSDEYGGYRKREPSRHRSTIYATPEQPLDAYGSGERSRPASVYGAPAARDRSRPNSMYAPERSPYRRDTASLQPAIGSDGVEVYPPGHILAGQPVSGSGFASSRNPSPNQRAAAYRGGLGGASPRIGGMGSAISPRVGAGLIPGASPRMGGGAPLAGAGGYGGPPDQLLPAPEAFNRPLNRAQTFTPFKDVRVQDLEELLDDVFHPMPPILSAHDVLPEDWGRLMHDLTLAWKGRLPLPADKPTKRSDLVMDLLDLWNTMFFDPRLVELVLYKGRNCRSGPGAGLPETRLLPEQLFAPGEFSNSEDESDEESESEYSDRYGSHGRRGHSQRRELARAQRKKQRVEEKVQREMELNKRYTLWLKYVDPREREYREREY
ncbi:hypothetical protein ACEPAF_6704 [Sanghuangporus sanghuang]